MFKTIFVPVDDHAASERALAVAAGLAQSLGSRVVLVHIVEPPPSYTVEVARRLPEGEFERAIKEHAEDILRGLQKTIPEGVAYQAFIRQAERRVWREVLESAQEHEADLIVMGTHGREGLTRFILGSVAEHVARNAEVPVMLVR
jgi:nucleotide-binding universal stress UspA family protein